jgi:hypothetical protein
MPAHASPGIGDEQIALPPDGLDPLRAIRVVAELFAQLRDAHIQNTIGAIVLAPVQLLEPPQ